MVIVLKGFLIQVGLVYKNLNLKEKLPTLTDKEQIKLLSNNGMLIKRPILVGNGVILIGFRKEEWEEKLK